MAKRFISQFLMPIPFVIELFVLGWVIGRFTRFKRTGVALKILSGCLFLAFGYGLGNGYLFRLERQYPPFDPTPEQCEHLRGTSIIVLGQGMPEKSDLPARYQNNSSFLCRLLEGVRVAKLVPDSRLIVSMAGEASNSVKQAALDDYMRQFDFPTNRVTMFTTARDTADEASLAKLLIGGQKSDVRGQSDQRSVISSINFSTLALSNFRTNSLILTTSAAHMPRAMHIFTKKGVTPIPAPCDYLCVSDRRQWSWACLPLPSGGGFQQSGEAAHEWFGSLYERLAL